MNERYLYTQRSFDDSDYLIHYGVKGMRWGVRRSPEQLGHSVRTGRSVVKRNSSKTLRSVGVVSKRTQRTRARNLKKAQRQRKKNAKQAKKQERQARKQAKEDAKLAEIQRKTNELNTKNAYRRAKLEQRDLRNKQFGIGQNAANKGPVRRGIEAGIQTGVSRQVTNAILSWDPSSNKNSNSNVGKKMNTGNTYAQNYASQSWTVIDNRGYGMKSRS